MAFIQRIQPAGDDRCEDHDGAACAVIDCVTTVPVRNHETGDVIHAAGAVVWHSHLHADLHPEHRLNPSHEAEDHRGAKPEPVTVTEWCDECKAHPAAAYIFAPSGG